MTKNQENFAHRFGEKYHTNFRKGVLMRFSEIYTLITHLRMAFSVFFTILHKIRGLVKE